MVETNPTGPEAVRTAGPGGARASWDPQQYMRFGSERLRPALDLLARVPLEPERVRTVVDLGCGNGAPTAILLERFPNAAVTGLDSSAAMLASLPPHPRVTPVLGRIEEWAPAQPVDLVFTNATLQWVGGHEALFPRLMEAVAPGGAFACQIPTSHGMPAYAAIREVAAEPEWAALLGTVAAVPAMLPPHAYYRLLAPRAREVDVWRTEYLHVLQGEDAVYEFVKGTGLRPYLDALPAERVDAFSATVKARLRDAYPPEADGRTLLLFPRLFMVALR